MSTDPGDQLHSHLLDPRLLPVTLLGITVGRPPRVERMADSGGPIILGEPGGCSGHGSLLHVVFDQSPSVTDDGGNDPLSRRHDETALAIHHVAAACRCRRERVRLVTLTVDRRVLFQPTY